MNEREETEPNVDKIKAVFNWLALLQYGVLAVLVAVAMYFALEK